MISRMIQQVQDQVIKKIQESREDWFQDSRDDEFKIQEKKSRRLHKGSIEKIFQKTNSHLTQVYNINLNSLKLVLRWKLHRIKIWLLNTQFTLEMALAFTLVTHLPPLHSPSFSTSPKWNFKLGSTHFSLQLPLNPALAFQILKASHFSTHITTFSLFNPR